MGYSLKYDFHSSIMIQANKHYKFLCLCFILLAGLRFYVGSDTHNYVYDFSIMPDFSNLSEYHRLESRYQLGWDVYVCLIKALFGNFVYVQLITAIIVNVLIFQFIKRSTTSIFLALLFYYVLNYFEYNTEIMREAISLSFGLVAIRYYERGKKLNFFLLLILAFEFHISAIILIITPFVANIKYSRKLVIWVFITSAFIPIVFSQISGLANLLNLFTGSDPEYLQKYLNQSLDHSRNLNYYIDLYVSYLLIPILCMLILKNRTQYTGLLIAFIIIRSMGMFTYAFYRFGNYFAPFYWILLADTTYYFWQRTRINKQILLILLTVFILFIYQRAQLGSFPEHPEHKLYERYIPYEMVNTTDHNYSIKKSKYYFRNGIHD